MIIAQLNLIIALFILILAFYVLKNNYKSKLNIFFSLSTFLIAFWVLLNYFFQSNNSILILRIIYTLAPFIIISIIIWINYLKHDKASKLFLISTHSFLLISAIFGLLMFTSSQMITKVIDYSNYETGSLFDYFSVFIIILFVYLFGFTFVEYKNSKPADREKFILIIIGVLLTSAIAAIVSFILPIFEITKYNVLDSTSSIFYVLFSFYSISRYKFLNVRLLASEILSAFLVIFSLLQIFSFGAENIVIKIIAFNLTLLIAFLLIYSINSESKRLKQIEKLNADLNKASQIINEKNKFLEELLNMKTEFLRVVNHQLNTPLSIMRNAFAMVEEKAITPEKGFGYAKSGLERISDTISDFWEAYELEGVKMKMNKSKTDLEKIVNTLIEEKKKLPAIDERKLEIKVEAPKFKIPEVYCDSQKMVHVISNLLDNAVFYTEKGSVTVSYEKSPKVLKIKITDTGMGIVPQNKEKLFQKFSRGQGAVTMKPDGSGLGLFIARKIIEGNDGQIGAESKGEGKGSTFYFTIPIFTKQSSQQL